MSRQVVYGAPFSPRECRGCELGTELLKVERERREALYTALQELVRKLEAISDDAQFQGIWGLAHTHGVRYAGPNWAAELKRAKTLLDELR